MRISIEVSEKTEGTSYPWWAIISMLRVEKDRKLVSTGDIIRSITGPFFSREEAEQELESRRYLYGVSAVVWCMSGYLSGQYAEAIRRATDANED